MTELYAHTPNDKGEWHYLKDHLQKVAELARGFADKYGAGDLAYWIGLWHDLGKCNPRFQSYLEACYSGKRHDKVQHAISGAALMFAYSLESQQNDNWMNVMLPIAGHHAGLHASGELGLKLKDYVEDNRELLRKLYEFSKQLLPPTLLDGLTHSKYERELFVRMIYSALVDADYLNTETHFNEELSMMRQGVFSFEKLWRRFEQNQAELMAMSGLRHNVNQVVTAARKEIYEACVTAAQDSQGIFRLTVPTGGGKTRSSLAFALRHILAHPSILRRIIIAIPYTTIIDQTVREYCKILGNEAVLEHHSQMPISETEDQTPDQVHQRLASENWDAPIIVTTNVQLFESLFSNRPGKVRKLHNIAGSVIILDEVQTLPVGVLSPVLDVLQTLVKNYGISVVLSSATQPAFHAIGGFVPKDIVPIEQFEKHFRKLARVHYTRRTQKLTWDELAVELKGKKQALVVLNSRKDALRLLEEMKEMENVFHLSTLLCGKHRKAVLRLIKCRLKQELPVLLISTQVVEAGVDIDFPEVWRATGPLDRIVQAAGRCNREGRMPDGGKVVIFDPVEGRMPKGEYRTGFGLADFLLGQYEPDKLHEPALHEEYFRRLYAERNLDEHDVQPYRDILNFPETAKRFRIISEDTVLVVVNYGSGEELLSEYKSRPSRTAWRRLQPYVVSLLKHEAQKLIGAYWLEPVSEGLYRWCGKYDRIKGLAEAIHDPADLIV